MLPVAHAQAVHIINITPNGHHQGRQSPLQYANGGVAPNIKRLRTFGCPVSVHDPYRKKTDGQFAGFPSIYLGPDPQRPEAHLVLNKSGKMVISLNEVIFNKNCQWLSFDDSAPFNALNRPPTATTYPDQIAAIEKSFEEDEDDEAEELPVLSATQPISNPVTT